MSPSSWMIFPLKVLRKQNFHWNWNSNNSRNNEKSRKALIMMKNLRSFCRKTDEDEKFRHLIIGNVNKQRNWDGKEWTVEDSNNNQGKLSLHFSAHFNFDFSRLIIAIVDDDGGSEEERAEIINPLKSRLMRNFHFSILIVLNLFHGILSGLVQYDACWDFRVHRRKWWNFSAESFLLLQRFWSS